MSFFFASAATDINWEAGYTVMDKELKKITRDAETGNRIADSLVKVRLMTGEEAFVMLHVEIQGSPEVDFAERMYTYNYRIYDRHRLPVAGFALLTDELVQWRPQTFSTALFGTRTNFEFETAKLLDFRDIAEHTMQTPHGTPLNPFAVITRAHLQAQATRGTTESKAKERFIAKVGMVRMLYKHHFSKTQIIEIFRFLDWVLTLSPALEHQLDTIIHEELEEEMPYLSRFERKAMDIGFEQGIEQGEQRKTVETARKLLPILQDKQISEVTGLSLEEVAKMRRTAPQVGQ